jgi:choline dehydrogenase-like flavoprotein
LNNRTIAYARGKGLGGCSLSNFGVYLYGSNEDYERWAELVGDAEWNWSHVRERFHAMEKYDAAGTNGYAHLADANAAKHGKDGRLGVGLPPVLERGVEAQMDALLEAGEVVNMDPNDGDVLGVSVFPMSYAKSGRTTSAGAFLQDSPSNLEIWTDAKVAKLVFEGNMVVGVETEDGRKGNYLYPDSPTGLRY